VNTSDRKPYTTNRGLDIHPRFDYTGIVELVLLSGINKKIILSVGAGLLD